MTRTIDLRRGWNRPLPIPRRLRLALPLSSLLTLTLAAGQAHAQSLGSAPSTPGGNPWQGIAVTITPPSDEAGPDGASPYEAAHQQAAAADRAATTPDTAAAAPAATEPEADAPSLWQVLTMGIGGDTPEPEKPAPAPNQLLPARKPVVTGETDTLPTSVDFSHGPASVAVSASASGSAPKSGFSGATAGGASGTVTGKVGYERDNLSIYGTGSLEASASTSVPTFSDNAAVGSSYSVPLAPLGLGQDKLGASVEMNSSRTTTTGVELRSPGNGYERFISVERSTGADATSSGVVKAGVLGKF